jgi:phosphomannomutase
VLNGSSLKAMQELKKQLKLTTLDLFETERDISFKLGSPIPNEERLKEFRDLVVAEKYDFAFATDGDGDRLAVIDDKGNFHDGNILCPLIYYFAVTQKNQKGPFIKNCAFSHIADKICNKLNVKLIQTPVGFKYLTKELVENNAVIGAEPTGCEVNNHVYTKDGLVVFALILEIVEFYKKPLSQIVKDFKEYFDYDTKYIEYSYKIKNKQVVMSDLQKNNPKFSKKIVERLTLDGFKYIFEDGSWALIRLSGTENLIRIISEQPTEKELNKILKEAKTYVDNLQ